MKEIETASDALGIWGSFEQLIKVLGFHDMASFFAVSIFIIIAVALLISFAIFLVKKRRERIQELTKIVLAVQKQVEEEPIAIPLKANVVPSIEKQSIKAAKNELGAALQSTRHGFIHKLSRLFSDKKQISDADFLEIESILFTADIGVKTAQKLLDSLRERVQREKSSDRNFLRTALKEEMLRILNSASQKIGNTSDSPQILMFVGVNGAGKTTSIGKLGALLSHSGKKVVFGAGDTFRAAATQQLSIWGERVGAAVISGKENSDPASVLFEAIEKAKAMQADYVLCDTAGRLHTKISLMDELKKVHRVMGKAKDGAPHQVFLVIDATMGQNALNQAREFAEAAPLTGVILAKLDGSAKGGIALGIVDELKVPIRYVGIGEQITDLKDFDAELFVDALFDEV